MAARALLVDPKVRLENALVTVVPLHNKRATMRVIAEKGGDYPVGTTDNTPKRRGAAVKALQDRLLWQEHPAIELVGDLPAHTSQGNRTHLSHRTRPMIAQVICPISSDIQAFLNE